MKIEFLLNGETVRTGDQPATRTLLDWLRETRKMTGTKEGCNEGDCGACTVMVSSLYNGKIRHQALNACILFLPQLHGKSVRTVEGLAGPGGELHPVQSAMVDHHGSQCGFCTPGFVMSMAAAHRNGEDNHNDVLAGNLCRCTGYAPIVKAAETAAKAQVPAWLGDETADLAEIKPESSTEISGAYLPNSIEDLADWYLRNPDATLIGGATDVGLWVTKRMADLNKPCFLSGIPELQTVSINEDGVYFGAAVNLNDVQRNIAKHHPAFAEMIRRYGSMQVRNAATLGGNIANGSPIGDGPPALIALSAILHLRRGDETRGIKIEDFFIDYGKQDIRPGEFVVGVTIPRQQDNLKCYKISKRFDQDISAVCGCFNVSLKDGIVAEARVAFGGMAATPKRASNVETALMGQIWDRQTIEKAATKMQEDFAPIDDMRASAIYRLEIAENLLRRYFEESQPGETLTHVLEVRP